MKALSVKQPWAELIASGRKTVEVRSWRTDYRGPLLVVASSQPNREAMARFGMLDLSCGVAVCIVELIDILHVTENKVRDAAEDPACCRPGLGDYLWLLSRPRRVKPEPIKGRLRLYEVDASLITLVG